MEGNAIQTEARLVKEGNLCVMIGMVITGVRVRLGDRSRAGLWK